MATNLALDDALINQAVEAGGHKTKREAVNAALRDYVSTKRRSRILELVGRVDYYDDFDPKALRAEKPRESL